MQRIAEHWSKEHKGLLNDIQELSSQITFFNLKWGTTLDASDVKDSQQILVTKSELIKEIDFLSKDMGELSWDRLKIHIK